MTSALEAQQTCPVCLALKALEELHTLELGKDLRSIKLNGKPAEYSLRTGLLAGALEGIARNAKGYCRFHRGGVSQSTRIKLAELFERRREEVSTMARKARG